MLLSVCLCVHVRVCVCVCVCTCVNVCAHVYGRFDRFDINVTQGVGDSFSVYLVVYAYVSTYLYVCE